VVLVVPVVAEGYRPRKQAYTLVFKVLVPVDAKSIHPRKQVVVLTRFRSEGWCWQEQAPSKTHTGLVFEGGEKVEVGRAQPPSFCRVEGVEVLVMNSRHRKRG
jgi:hypothetical protein